MTFCKRQIFIARTILLFELIARHGRDTALLNDKPIYTARCHEGSVGIVEERSRKDHILESGESAHDVRKRLVREARGAAYLGGFRGGRSLNGLRFSFAKGVEGVVVMTSVGIACGASGDTATTMDIVGHFELTLPSGCPLLLLPPAPFCSRFFTCVRPPLSLPIPSTRSRRSSNRWRWRSTRRRTRSSSRRSRPRISFQVPLFASTLIASQLSAVRPPISIDGLLRAAETKIRGIAKVGSSPLLEAALT